MPKVSSKKTEPAPTSEQLEIQDWLNAVGADGEVFAKVHRVAPVVDSSGTDIKGYLDTVHDLKYLDEGYIKKRWGGGKYQIKLFDGDKKYLKAHTISVSGEPRGEDEGGPRNGEVVYQAPPEAKEDTRLQLRAMEANERAVEAERDRAARLEQKIFLLQERLQDARNAPDPRVELLEQEKAKLEEQFNAEKRRLEDKIERLMDKLDEMPKAAGQQFDSFARAKSEELRDIQKSNNELMQTILGGKSSEIMAIRENHASEMRSMRQNYESQIAALNERIERTQEYAREDQKRVLSEQKVIYEGRIQSAERAFQSQIDLLKVQLENAQAETKLYRKELETLRAEKNKGALEMVKEIGALKEGLDAFGGGDDGEDKATWEKVTDAINTNPLVKGLATRLGVSGSQQQPQLTEQQAAQLHAAQQQAQAQAQPQQPQISQEEVLNAIVFTENAIQARNVGPQQFARSIQNTLPQEIVNELVKSGADGFAESVGQVRPNSVISTMAGKKFLREVIQYLSGTEDSPEVVSETTTEQTTTDNPQ